MERVWQIGLIGCGAIARKKHLPLCRQLPQVHLRGLFSKNRAHATAAAAEFGDAATEVFPSAEEMLACKEIDIIVICTPNSTHAAYSIAALNHGKHVICEKPMAMTSEEARAMLTAAEENHRMLHISYQNRFLDSALLAKHFVDQGELDNIYYAKAYAVRRRAVPTWGGTTQLATTGGGCLMDIGSHAIDLALWLCDNFTPLYAVGTTYDHIAKRGSNVNHWGTWDPADYELEDCALGFVVMRNGMTLTIDATYALNVEAEMESSVDLFGVKGGLTLRPDQGVTLIQEQLNQMCVTKRVSQHTQRALTLGSAADSPAGREYKAVLDMLNGGAVTDPGAEQAYVVLRIVEGIYRSAKTGKPVYF